MKNISILLSIVLISAHLQIQADYWKNNSWYTYCHQLLYGQSIEHIIPDLIEKRDQNLIVNKDYTTCPCTHLIHQNKELCIKTISSPINSGITYEVLQKILENLHCMPNYSIQLRYDNHGIINGPTSVGSYIILDKNYYQFSDAIKLFTLYHELQHHLYNDIANNHLTTIIAMAETSELKEKLEKNKDNLSRHIKRYIEYRADRQAMLSMQCPYCLEEIARTYSAIYKIIQSHKQNSNTYNPDGYLCDWQFQPHINQLKSEKKCCQHHYNTGNKIDVSITNESSMLNRLIIMKS